MFMQATFKGPTRMLLHSVEGFGKTTLAAFFPKPAFICGERAFPRDLGFAPYHSEPKSWEEVLGAVRFLIETPHDFETLVFDTFDWIDPLIQRYVCNRDSGRKTEMNPKSWQLESIEDYGFGKGYIVVAEEVRRLLSLLDELQAKRRMHVVVLMHSWVKEFKNPAGDNFDRWQPKMHERSARVLVEWAENVLFGYFEVLATKDDPKDKKAKGVSTNRRILGTRHSALYDAKNRFNLPDTVELKNPSDLIPYLVGVHLNPPPAHAANPPMQPSVKQQAPKTETPKTEAKVEQRDTAISSAREEQQGPQNAPKSDKPISEQIKDALATPAVPPPASALPPNIQQLDDATQADVAAMLKDAADKCGEKYAAQVMGWLSQAGTDAKKIDSIFATVTKAIAAATNNVNA